MDIKWKNTFFAGILAVSMTICGCSSHSDGSNLPETEENAEPTDSAAENAAITEKPSQETYEYINPNGKTLEKRINVPQRYIRTEEKSDSLANFLRAYKMNYPGAEPSGTYSDFGTYVP